MNFISGKTEAKKHRNKDLEKNQKIEEFHIFSLYKC